VSKWPVPISAKNITTTKNALGIGVTHFEAGEARGEGKESLKEGRPYLDANGPRRTILEKTRIATKGRTHCLGENRSDGKGDRGGAGGRHFTAGCKKNPPIRRFWKTTVE